MTEDDPFLAALSSLLEDHDHEEAEREDCRARSHAQLLDIEEGLLAIVDNPGPLAVHGELVRDSHGNLVPDERVRNRAARAAGLAFRQLRAIS